MANRDDVVKILQSWVGAKKGDSTHRFIVDKYNEIKPLPNGYKVKYTDAWCATTVSSAYHCANIDNIFPCSASCSDMINRAKKMGIWVEDDKFVPSKADAVLYDWNDGTNYATTDCTGAPEHVGCVQKVENGIIYVIEGNYGTQSKVAIRKLPINGRYIRGFVTPNFGNAKPVAPTTPTTSHKTLKKGMQDPEVLYLHQQLFKAHYGVNRQSDVYSDLTESCIRHLQASNPPTLIDGICGQQTWALVDKIK